MADINVERRRSSAWIWVVGLIVVALLVWALSMLFSGDDAGGEGSRGGEMGANEAPAATLAVGGRST